SELVVTPVLWPDFSADDFRAALEAYAERDRRFGGIRGGDALRGGTVG
ncbi:MAG: undecaprenyl diphosphate synthase family protein, partial [Lentisphaerae bacterium]|nr:undecaprenyl diphosphate synthase family protein [Lentisphaerota bacterium]